MTFIPANAKANETSLVDACERQQWPEVRELLTQTPSLDTAQPDGMTALHWAVYHRQPEITQALLDRGANANATTDYLITPLNIACELGDATIAETLLASGADVDQRIAGQQTPLMTAARTGDLATVQTLVRHDADVNAKERRGQTALMWAATEGHADVVRELLTADADPNHMNGAGFTALMFAARHGRITVADALLDADVDVNAVMKHQKTWGRRARKRTSALLLATESAHFELALRLVRRGADPNDLRSEFAPLHAVTWVRKAQRGDDPAGDPPPRGSGDVTSLQFVRELVSLGADVNLQTVRGKGGRARLNMKGCTPIMLASRGADLSLIKLLVELGADATIKNADGATTIMAAAGVDSVAVGEHPGTEPEVIAAIEYLVTLGVDINAVDATGETAMHGAGYRNYANLATALGRLGADPTVWNTKNKYNTTPIEIAAGKRPGSFKFSPETVAAMKAMLPEATAVQP